MLLMRAAVHVLIPLIATAGAASVVLAPVAAAEPTEESTTLQPCDTAGEGGYVGTTTTTCQTPGNVQIAATAPQPVYPYPWDDEFYGPALIIGGGRR